jgi:hypothetical protein
MSLLSRSKKVTKDAFTVTDKWTQQCTLFNENPEGKKTTEDEGFSVAGWTVEENPTNSGNDGGR